MFIVRSLKSDLEALLKVQKAFAIGQRTRSTSQIDLLFRLVEAARNTSREDRQPFFVMQAAGRNYARVNHPGISNKSVYIKGFFPGCCRYVRN